MNQLKPIYIAKEFSNYQWLLYYILIRDDNLCQHILNDFYIDEPTKQFLDHILVKDENGEISPKSTEYDQMVKSLSSFFDLDVYETYKTNCEYNIYCWDEFQRNECEFKDFLHSNVIENLTLLWKVSIP